MEVLFNDNSNRYTLKKEVDGKNSSKRVPIKFKIEDSTSRFRKEELKKELLG